MHEVDITPVPMQVIGLDLPLISAMVGAAAARATSTSLALAPSITTVRQATVAAVAATSAGNAQLSTVTGVIGPAGLVIGTRAISTAVARAPVVGYGVTVNAVVAAATADAVPVPNIISGGDVLVAALRATASASAKIPVVAGGMDVTVTAVRATSTASARIPVTSQIIVTAIKSGSTSISSAPAISSETVLTGGGPGTASMIAIPPTVSAPSVQIDGGPNYYSQFAPNALPDDPTFFPVGVWLQYAGDSVFASDQAIGINTYVCTFSSSQLNLLPAGMYAILQGTIYDEFWTDEVANPAVVGWELYDEIDMSMSPPAAFTELDRVRGTLPVDNRMRWNNYGKGVAFWHSNADAAQLINNYQDVASIDLYWFTDPNIHHPWEGGILLNSAVDLTYDQTRRASNYGYTIDRVRALDAMTGGRKPIWGFVEVGWPFSETLAQGTRLILPAEMRAAVWHCIIAGARGITYFAHSFGGPFPTNQVFQDTVNYAAMIAQVTSVNALIKSLATVLNSPFDPGYVSASASVRVMCKNLAGKRYLFAGSKENVSSTGTFTLSGVTTGTATVMSESRTIAITGGQFSDAFADGNAIHIYRID